MPGTSNDSAQGSQQGSVAAARPAAASSRQGLPATAAGVQSARWQPGAADASTKSLTPGERSSKWRRGTVVPDNSDAAPAKPNMPDGGTVEDRLQGRIRGSASSAMRDHIAEHPTPTAATQQRGPAGPADDDHVLVLSDGGAAAGLAGQPASYHTAEPSGHADDHVMVLSEGGNGSVLPSDSCFVERIPAWHGPQQEQDGAGSTDGMRAAVQPGSAYSRTSGAGSLPNTTMLVSAGATWGVPRPQQQQQQQQKQGKGNHLAAYAESCSSDELAGQQKASQVLMSGKQPLTRRIDYGDRKPIRREVSWWATLVLLCYLAAVSDCWNMGSSNYVMLASEGQLQQSLRRVLCPHDIACALFDAS